MNPNLTNKSYKELLALAEYTEALKEKFRYNKLQFIYPEHGKYSRKAYYKAMEFYEAGKLHRFRMIGGANGSGKSFTVACELVYHITGDYPAWWKGRVQEAPKHWWIVSESGDTFKSTLQRLLLGDTLNDEDIGTGLIPKDRIVKYTGWPSISGAVRSIEVRHKKGHIVTIEVKSSDQARENLQGANLDGVLFDEEPPMDIYTECVFRLRGNPSKPPGISLLAFTPLKGLTEVVLNYLDNGQYPDRGVHPKDPDKYVVRIEMDEVPHLTEEDKRAYLANCSPNEIEARTKGYPALGSGKIYPYPESQVFVKPFPIPEYWPRAYALDFGHHVTCALWGAKDPHTNTIYIYAEYYAKSHQTAQVHALNIKQRGAWIAGICDPSGGGRQNDGRLLQDLFVAEGLDLTPGENSVLVGITRNCNMFENGSLKIFDNLENTKKEYRVYRFDTKDPNVPARNQDDHAMDALKYLTSMFDYVAKSDIDEFTPSLPPKRRKYDSTTGY